MENKRKAPAMRVLYLLRGRTVVIIDALPNGLMQAGSMR